jgi:hypothetical protein
MFRDSFGEPYGIGDCDCEYEPRFLDLGQERANLRVVLSPIKSYWWMWALSQDRLHVQAVSRMDPCRRSYRGSTDGEAEIIRHD